MQLLHKDIHKHVYITMSAFTFCFVVLGAFYIYGINETAVHAFGKKVDNKRLAQIEEELRALETERTHLAIGSWLEGRARQYELVAGGKVHVVSRDTSIARAGN